MAYTNFPIKREWGSTIQWQYQLTGQGSPSSVSLKPENPKNNNLLLTNISVEWTGTGLALAYDISEIANRVRFGCYINGPDESEEFAYFSDYAGVTAPFALSAQLNTEILLRPEFGLVFNVSGIKDASGTDMAIMFKARGTRVDPSTSNQFL